jgi:hypothetical protein
MVVPVPETPSPPPSLAQELERIRSFRESFQQHFGRPLNEDEEKIIALAETLIKTRFGSES